LAQEFDKLRDCPVLVTLAAIGGKWRTRILWRLREGPAHFSELRRSMDISEKVLSENLKALERKRIIRRAEIKAGQVITTEYSYSDLGLSLMPVLDAMGQWGLDHGDADRSPQQ
jgi:DNA-binding HxlR family transcriptional regulator